MPDDRLSRLGNDHYWWPKSLATGHRSEAVSPLISSANCTASARSGNRWPSRSKSDVLAGRRSCGPVRAAWPDERDITTPIDYIFDEQGDIGRKAQFWYSAMKDAVPAPGRALMGGIPSFQDDTKTPPLQAADQDGG